MTDGVLLMAYGSPDRLDQVEAYYTHIRGGRAPSPELLAELTGRYAAIGGGSPLSGIVERQRAALEAELAQRGRPMAVHAGMRHIEPFIADVVGTMAADGIDRAVGIALAPQASSHSSEAYRRIVEESLLPLGGAAPVFRFVASWHDQPRLIEALAAAVRETLGLFDDPASVRVLFTAHSLPLSIVEHGDPYPSEVARTAALVAERVGLAGYDVAYQSAGRTGEAWLGPEIRDEIRRLAREGSRGVLVCPVGFVADHLEVLYDVDIEAQAVAREEGVHLERTRSMNDDPTFISGLADLVEAALPSEAMQR